MPILVALTLVFIALVGYVYIGYPLLLGIAARLGGKPVLKASHFPPFSLIISALNEEQVIREKIENSLQLAYPKDKLEIIVVADGSTDGTAGIAAAYPEVTVLYTPARKGKASAINRGVAHSRGEVLLFSDANSIYDLDAVRKLAANFADPEVGCAVGHKTVARFGGLGSPEGVYWRYESWIQRNETLLGSTSGVTGEILAVRRSFFKSIPEHIINDDSYTALQVLRSGARVVYEPDAVACERPSASHRADAVRRRRMVAGRCQLLFRAGLWPVNNRMAMWQLLSHKFLRLLLPFFMVGALLLNLLCLYQPGSYTLVAILFAVQAGFYGLAILGCLADRSGIRLRPASLACFVVRSNLSSLLGFWDYMRGNQSVLWERVERL